MKRLHEDVKEEKQCKKICTLETKQDTPNNLFQFHHYFMLYDTESTDKVVSESDIISIGAVICEYDDGFVRPQTFHTFVNTNKAINSVAEAVHHIHQSDLANQPYFPAAIKLWIEWICL